MTVLTGIIFDIERFAIKDGPGIRTTLFLKGCLLRCIWCHNPESIEKGPELFFNEARCIGCRRCVEACRYGVHVFKGSQHLMRRELCQICGRCVGECYTSALEIVGKKVTVKQVLEEIEKDRPFYENSGGGVTLSGGEPLMQMEFTKELLRRCRLKRLHTVLQTCGQASWESFKDVLQYVNLLFFDVKEIDPAKHKEFTGVSNERILSNLKKASKLGIPISIRAPVIPGYNDRSENFEELGKILSKLENIEEVKLLPYHQLAKSKYVGLGREYKLRGLKPPKENKLKQLKQLLRKYGLVVKWEKPEPKP